MRHHRACRWCWVLCLVAQAAVADNEICLVAPVDGSAENGVGAEAGVVREFVQDLDIPLECRTDGGNTWVLGHELRVTRVTPSAATVTAEISVRMLEPGRSREPVQVLIESRFIEISTSVFPAIGVRWTDFDRPQRAAPALGIGPSVKLDGDLTQNQFVTVDQSPTTPLRTCWTRTGTLAWEVCTNGNPAIRGIGLSVRVAPIFADLPPLGSNSAITSTVPNAVNQITLDFSGIGPASSVINSIDVLEAGGSIPICSSAGVFPFLCPLTETQAAMARQSQLVVLVAPRIVPLSDGVPATITAQLISADHYVFANGFESGDPGFWTSSSP